MNEFIEDFIDVRPEIRNDNWDIQNCNLIEKLKNTVEGENFIYQRFNKNNVRFINRVNKVKRLVKILLGITEYNIENINVKETKLNNDKILKMKIFLHYSQLWMDVIGNVYIEQLFF